MIFAATFDLASAPPPGPAREALSRQALSAISSQPFSPPPAEAPGGPRTAILVNGRGLPASVPAITSTETNTGRGSVSQAATSVSLVMALPATAKRGP